MAASIGSLVLKLAVDSQALYSGLASASARVASFGASTARALTAPFSSALSSLGSIGLASQGLSAIKGLFTDTIGESVKLAARLEQTSMAFEVMTGSAEKGRKLLADLTQFSIATPFEPTEIINAGQRLMGYGMSADKLIPTLKVLGDVSAGSGKDLGELAVIFGQIRAAGRLLGQDANQLAQAGIPIIAKLAEHYKVTTGRIVEMKEAGQISFADVALTLQKMTQSGGNYANMMERQSTTLLGLWSTLSGNVKLAMIQIGQAAIEGLDLKALTKDFTAWVAGVTGQIKGLLLPAFRAMGGVIRGALDVVGQVWRDFIKPAFDAMAERAGAVGDTFKTWRVGAIEAIEMVSKAVARMAVTVQHIGDLMADAFGRKLTRSLADAAQETARFFTKGGPAGMGLAMAFNQMAADWRKDLKESAGKPPVDLKAALDKSDADVAAFFDKLKERAAQAEFPFSAGGIIAGSVGLALMAARRKQLEAGMDIGSGSPASAAAKEMPKAAEFGSAEAARVIDAVKGKGEDERREIERKQLAAAEKSAQSLERVELLLKNLPIGVATF